MARARIISQTIHPFMSLHAAFYAGVPDILPEHEESPKDDEEKV